MRISTISRIKNRINRKIKDKFAELILYLNFGSINLLTPVDKFSQLTALSHFSGIYQFWRISRIKQILEIFTIEELSSFRILEVGAGNCEIGAFFADLGAEVTSLEGRLGNVNIAKLRWSKIKNLNIIHSDLDYDDLSKYGEFDLIINFGLIYHLKNIEEHLTNCSKISKHLILDTWILDSKEEKILLIKEDNKHITASLNGLASRPTINYLEKLFYKLGYDYKRLENGTANSHNYIYDWVPKNDNKVKGGHFKMWYCCK